MAYPRTAEHFRSLNPKPNRLSVQTSSFFQIPPAPSSMTTRRQALHSLTVVNMEGIVFSIGSNDPFSTSVHLLYSQGTIIFFCSVLPVMSLPVVVWGSWGLFLFKRAAHVYSDLRM